MQTKKKKKEKEKKGEKKGVIRYYNFILPNLKFQHKPKYHLFQKSSYKNRPIIIT